MSVFVQQLEAIPGGATIQVTLKTSPPTVITGKFFSATGDLLHLNEDEPPKFVYIRIADIAMVRFGP